MLRLCFLVTSKNFIMPKIKLSALVSDMKGKSQGSVFSTNSGGTYFRNNPSGGGRKSAKWDDQKNRFGSLATRWKALSDDQRAAWNEAASSYPTVNAFGDARLPSGYELYMRLNGTLVSNSLPVLTLPQVQRPLPDVTEIDLFTPDLFMFTPSRQFKTSVGPGTQLFGYKSDFFDSETLEIPNTFAVRFNIPQGQNNVASGKAFTNIFTAQSELGGGAGFYYGGTSAANGQFVFVANLVNDDDLPVSYVGYFPTGLNLGSDSHHVAVRFIMGTELKVQVYLNGNLLDVVREQWYDSHQSLNPLEFSGSSISAQTLTPVSNFSGSFLLGTAADYSALALNFSDFVWFQNLDDDPNCCTDPSLACPPDYSCESWWNDICECYNAGDPGSVSPNPIGSYYIALLSYGYVLGFERVRIGLNYLSPYGRDMSGDLIPRTFINETSFGDQYDLRIGTEPECVSNEDCQNNPLTAGTGNDVECIDGVCTYVGDSLSPWALIGNSYVPWTYFAGADIVEEGFYIQILCTGSISAGRSLQQTKYVKVATIPLTSALFNLTDALKSAIVNMPGGSSYGYKAYIIDGTTGVMYDMVVPAKDKKGVRRFKAGAELSGNV